MTAAVAQESVETTNSTWATIPLGKLCRIELGKTPARGTEANWDTGKTTNNVWLSIADMPLTTHAEALDSREYVSGLAAQSMKLVPKGTLLVSFKLTLGRLCYAGRELFTNEAIASLLELDESKILKEYLYWYLTYFDWDEAAAGDHKIKGKTLNKAKLKELPILLPSIDEQKQIVAVLDQAFAALDRARAQVQENLADSTDFFENVLASAFTSNRSSWKLATFSDLEFLRIIDGDRGKNYPKKKDFGSSGDCLFLNTKNVRPNGFNFSEATFISREKDEALSKGKLSKRDVVLTTRGTIGNVGIFDDTVPFDEIRINSGMLILRPNEEKLRSEYLFAFIRSNAFKDQVARRVSGTAQPQLPIRSLRQFTLLMPKNLSEQITISIKLDELEKKHVELRTQYRAAIADIANLRQSLLQRAFAGQLHTGPTLA